jgi:hypothetical protein
MKNLIVFLASFILITPAFPQIKRDAVWCFGDSVLVDFNQSPPNIGYSSTRSRGSNCSIADSSGNLLFYAHSGYLPFLTLYARGVVWNKNHEVMENGDSLYAGGWYKEMVIIPDPGNHLRYYLFHTGVTLFSKLYYSVIDLSYNGGLGKVTLKNVLPDTLPAAAGLTDGLTAIKHGNGRDWWVMFRVAYNDGTIDNTFYKLLISPDGISEFSTQSIGLTNFNNILSLYFNHTGNQLLLINANGLIELYDFDRCTGELSNLRTIHPENNDPNTAYLTFFWSAEFSPNDEVLYVTTMSGSVSYLYQYNLSASNIASTKLVVDSLNAPSQGGDLKLAKDGKIYWAGIYDTGPFPFPYPDSVYNQYNMNLSIINQPNILGKATDINKYLCDFQKYSFYLGGHRTYYGLPNNPNYDMIAKGASICDTLGLPNAVDEYEKNKIFSIYPNPANESVTLFHNAEEDADISVMVYDLSGRLVLIQSLESNILNIQTLKEGIYVLNLYVNQDPYSMIKLTVLK